MVYQVFTQYNKTFQKKNHKYLKFLIILIAELRKRRVADSSVNSATGESVRLFSRNCKIFFTANLATVDNGRCFQNHLTF